MVHSMKLTSDPFERIKRGVKRLEVRLFDDKRKNIAIGDKVTFLKLPDLKDSIETEVIGLSTFHDFRTLFEVFGTNFFGHAPETTVDEQVADMFEVYTQEDESKYGVIGIHFKLVR
ncbi:hypothetical protein K9M74_04835 [Candidatus Woesearchaeota archaeon]|nr:hypothetical protein [Candidatus Woesearchaeota archaeon]